MRTLRLFSCLLIACVALTATSYAELNEYEEGQEEIDGQCYDYIILRDLDKNEMVKFQKCCGDSPACWEKVYEGPIPSYTPTNPPGPFYPVQFDGNGNGLITVAAGRGGYLHDCSSCQCYPWTPNNGTTIVMDAAFFVEFQ